MYTYVLRDVCRLWQVNTRKKTISIYRTIVKRGKSRAVRTDDTPPLENRLENFEHRKYYIILY